MIRKIAAVAAIGLAALLGASPQAALAAPAAAHHVQPARAAQARAWLARQVQGLSDAELAAIARMSVQGSAAPPGVQGRLLAGIDAWLAAAPALAPEAGPLPPGRAARLRA